MGDLLFFVSGSRLRRKLRDGSGLHLSGHSLKSMCELLEEILDDPLIVVAPAQNVVKRGKAVGLAGFFLVVQLLGLELMIADHAPVIARRIHREARGKSSVDADDHRILSGAAVP